MRPRLQEPIDVLEVLVDEADKSKGVMYYGFSGCHRYEAHQRLGLETIRCKVRRATRGRVGEWRSHTASGCIGAFLASLVEVGPTA